MNVLPQGMVATPWSKTCDETGWFRTKIGVQTSVKKTRSSQLAARRFTYGVLFGKVPLVVVPSLRRKFSVTAALGLLLLPGCHASREFTPYAAPIRSPVRGFPGLPVSCSTVASQHSTVFSRYPRLGQSHPLTVEIRTIMAQRQTTFLEDLPEEGTPELHQDMDFLAVSPEVVGARIT